VKSLAEKLLGWYRRSRRRLPWREDPAPYKTWVSELMLQQTRVETVIPYFLRFLERFPDVRVLAAASEQEVLSQWSGLGYYRRAKALHRAARIIVEERGGRLPDDVSGWLALPGIGRYTAGAIVSIGLGKRAPILDGNVQRVLARLYGLKGDPRKGETHRRLWQLAEEILPEECVSEFNQGLMELGALVCLPRNPTCLLCPLREDCFALREGTVGELPELSPKPEVRSVLMGAAVVEKDRKILLYRRTRTELMKDLWELPLAECREGEDARAALARETASTYGINIEPGDEVACVRHSIMNRRITLQAFSSELVGRASEGKETEHRWVDRDERASLPLSSMVRKVLDRVDGGS
jgi:A/G-specific adenine glycosylase